MYLFVKKEIKKKDIQKMWGMQGTCLMPFLNFFFDDMQYINTCIVCREKNGGEIRSMTTSQDNISDIGKHPQVNIKQTESAQPDHKLCQTRRLDGHCLRNFKVSKRSSWPP